MLSVATRTPEGQVISQFLQFEQYSRLRSISSSANFMRLCAGPVSFGPAKARVASVTGQFAMQQVQAMQWSAVSGVFSCSSKVFSIKFRSFHACAAL